MSNKQLIQDSDKKTEIIKALSSAIDKHTRDANEAWEILNAILQFFLFFENMRYRFPQGLASDVRILRNSIQEAIKNKTINRLHTFDTMADSIQEAIMLSAACADGLIILSSKEMRKDLDEISENYLG